MLSKRVIPTLLINKNGDLVKGQSFKNHKYVGDPINAVKIFNDKEVDELVILDISATKPFSTSGLEDQFLLSPRLKKSLISTKTAQILLHSLLSRKVHPLAH